jgi:hypothetical protein
MSKAVSRQARSPLTGGDLHRAVPAVLARHHELDHCRAFLFPGREPLPLAPLGAVRAELEELPTLRAFDAVDLCRVDEEFRDHALRQAIPLDG